MTWANAHDWLTLRRDRKAITALFPYAVWQERYRQQTMILDVLLRAANASRSYAFLWYCIQPFMKTLLNDASDVSLKRVAILASPYIPWRSWEFQVLIQAWVKPASAIPKEKEVASSVVDTLLRIACFGLLLPDNRGDVFSWLTLRPSLPPICIGRRLGSHRAVMNQVRELGDIEILKSYFLLVWSEWDPLRGFGFRMMCESIRKDFTGVEANPHRAELVQRLDHVIGQLDRGLAYLQRERPELKEENLQKRKDQYETLRKILREDPEAPEILTCMSSGLTNHSDL